MKPTRQRAVLAVSIFFACSALGGAMLSAVAAQPTPAPKSPPSSHGSPKPVELPTPRFPSKKLHTEFLVEVNKKGQVVRVRSGKSCDVLSFNAQTYGNVLQMWIRHPDGSAEVGVYRVTYDYNPNDHSIRRGVSLVHAGGNWGDKEGAANEMVDVAKREQAKQAASEHSPPPVNLPSLESITGTPHPKPSSSKSPSPKPSPTNLP